MANPGSGNGSGPNNFDTGNQTPPINQTTNPNPNVEQVVNNNPPPPTPAASHVHVHYSNTPVPKFDGDEDKFGTWKARMLLHFGGIDRYMLKILKDGPYVPMTTGVNPLLDPNGRRGTREKAEDHWSDEDRRLVDLDTRLKNMILGAVPEDLIPTLVLFPSAKCMWDELILQFEGGSDTLSTRKVALNKKYETFFAEPNESLTGTYTRFTSLINQLRGLGIEKDKDILLEKFCDILPSKWENMILVLRQGKTLYSHTLASLYGAFRFTENNNAQRVVAEQDSLNHARSSKGVNLNNQPCAALMSAENVQSHSMKEMLNGLLNSGLTTEISDDCYESDNDDLVAMIAKTFNRFKHKSNRFNGSKNASSSNSLDKANLTCYKCGKKGHFMKECRSSQMNNQTGAPALTYNKPDDSYKSKYKKLKAQIALLSLEKEKEQNKCLVAKTEEKWELSDDSSDDEEEIRDVCFMALEDDKPKHLVKDDVVAGRWVDIILKKVYDYDIEADTERKLDIAESLSSDLSFVETIRTDCELYLQTVLTEVNNLRVMCNDFQSVQLALKEAVALNEALNIDNQKLESDLEKEKMVIKTWVRASGRNYDACTNTISAQIRAIGAGDMEMAAAIPDIHEMPANLRVETPYDQPECSKAKSVETTPVEVETGANLAKAPVIETSGEKSRPQKSKLPKTKKGKQPAEPQSKAQLPDENNKILLRMEEQLQLLSRQVQSCTAKIKNLEGTSTPPVSKQTVIEKPTLVKNKKKIVPKGTKFEKKKGVPPMISQTFTPEVGNSSASFSSSQTHKTEDSQVESSEPTVRRVPKKN